MAVNDAELTNGVAPLRLASLKADMTNSELNKYRMEVEICIYADILFVIASNTPIQRILIAIICCYHDV